MPGMQLESSRLHHAFRQQGKFPGFIAKVALMGPLCRIRLLYSGLETGTTAITGFGRSVSGARETFSWERSRYKSVVLLLYPSGANLAALHNHRQVQSLIA